MKKIYVLMMLSLIVTQKNIKEIVSYNFGVAVEQVQIIDSNIYIDDEFADTTIQEVLR